MTTACKVMIAAAGTGGHVFPGLAVAEALRLRGVDVVWLGTNQGKAQAWVNSANLPYTGIDMQGLRGKGVLGWLALPWRLWKAYRQAVAAIRYEQPSLLLVMGGYVSAPAGLAAKWLGVPIWLHEQNAIAGLSNRLLAPMAEQVFLGMPLQYHPAGWQSAQWIGNPLRAALSRQTADDWQGRRLRVLVLGGSQGAQFINRLMPKVWQQNTLAERLSIHHQTGVQDEEAVRAAYGVADQVQVSAFIQDMASAYAWADVIVARAGALTVAEVTQVGRPACFIPFPAAVDDHQYHNAMTLVSQGAAIVIRQENLTADSMAAWLGQLLDDHGYADSLRTAASQLPQQQAASQLADAIVTRCRASQSGSGV